MGTASTSAANRWPWCKQFDHARSSCVALLRTLRPAVLLGLLPFTAFSSHLYTAQQWLPGYSAQLSENCSERDGSLLAPANFAFSGECYVSPSRTKTAKPVPHVLSMPSTRKTLSSSRPKAGGFPLKHKVGF